MSKVHDITCDTLATWLENGEALLVDVRETGEHAGARIAGSHLNPLSRFDPTAFTPVEGQKLVLYCGSGMCSRKAGKKLIALGHREAFHLAGGLMDWKRAGFPVQSAA